jgi:hypothetical protein
MSKIQVSFILGEVSEEDVLALKNNQPITCKLLLTPEDLKLFAYSLGDLIEIETRNGHRLWSTIIHQEIIENAERVIIILTLKIQ